MELSERQKVLLDSVIDEKLDQVVLENEYIDFQRAELKKRGLSSPFQIKDPVARKKFFTDLSKAWAQHKASKV